MRSNIFLPDKIKVGFQKRYDTYTEKLAYVIYYDNKGVLRKEKSWQNWRDQKIKPEEFENVPMSGFVLNKKVGGYKSDWNYRQSYIRIYDPRGFEFEITLENMLFILENSTCVKGKGLEGEFIYGWDGTELVLLPVESEEYKNISKFNNEVFKGDIITAKNLIVGETYLNKDNGKMIYLGEFECINEYNSMVGKKYIFKEVCGDFDCGDFGSYVSSTIKDKNLVKTEKPIRDVTDLIKAFKNKKNNYPHKYYEPSKHEYKEITFEKFCKIFMDTKTNTRRSWGDSIKVPNLYRKIKVKYSLLNINFNDDYDYDLYKYNYYFSIGRNFKIQDDNDFELNLKKYFDENGPFYFHYDKK